MYVYSILDLTNLRMSPSHFWDVIQCSLVVSYWYFRTAYNCSQLQESRSPTTIDCLILWRRNWILSQHINT